MKHFTLLLLTVVLACATANAQMNIGSNQAPDSSAMLQISGNTKGFLPPRMTRDTMLLIRNPAKGLVVFNTTDSALFMRRDTGWVKLFSAGTVTSASVVSANGLSGSVNNSTTTPAITLSTTVTGMVKGNGTALSVATSGTDYAPGTAGNATGIVKSTTGTGALTTATASDFPTLNQNTTGTASNITGVLNATSHPALVGDVTTPSGSVTTTISNSAVTNAKMASMAANTFKANNTGSSTAPSDITATQATAMLDPFTSSAKGLVPASGGGTANFLRADGSFAVPPGSNSGTVTSTSVVTANGLAGTVATNTTTPAITLSTTVTGMVKGNGTALSAATSGTDYAPGTAANTTGIVKSTTGTGALTTAAASDFPTLNQNTTGTAANITGVLSTSSFPALTGDVTTTAGSVNTTIGAGAVSNTKLGNMATQTFKGRTTAGTGAPEDLTPTQATAMLNTFSSATKGLVPASGGGTTTFLRADGTFATPTGPGTGTVTSVSVTTANGVSGTVSNASTTPAISLTLGAITPTSVTASGDISSTGNIYADNGSANTGAKTPGLIFGGASSGEGISSKRTVGGSGFGLDFYTNNLNRMSITQGGNVGIGNSSPSYKLYVAGTSDPLYLSGVNTGTSTSADSILTITSGVVKKLPVSTFATPGNSWSITGNSGTNPTNHFVGTTDNQNLLFRTNNTQRMLLDNAGNVAIGASPTFSTYPEKLLVDAGTTQSYNVISGKGNLNNYLQLNIQNTNAGGSASSDVVATADNGNEGANYIDMGINSSGNTANYFGGANDAYLYNVGQNMLIGTASESRSVVFLTGGGTQSTNERMRINGSGNVGIGITAPANKLHVVGTNPLALSGVQTGTNADSVLTISGGVVKMLAPSGLNTSATAWSLFGNSNTAGDGRFLGTTNTEPLIIKVNSQPTGRIDTSNTYLGYQSGYSNGTTANKNTGIGNHALFSNTNGAYNTALGYGALQNNATGNYNIGIGNNSSVANNSSSSIAIGTNTNINNANSIAIGTTAQTNNTNALSLGNNTYTNGNFGISIGNGSGAQKTQGYADYATAIGYNAYAGGTNSISIGSATNNNQANAIAIGNTAVATGANSISIGATANTNLANSIAIGNGATASFANSVAIGYNASAQSDNTIVLGDKSNANVSVAIGPDVFTTGAREKLLVDAGTSTSFNVISAKGSLNNYLQLNVQNRNAGGGASSDLVATADNGDESNNYVDLGINSSGNNSGSWGAANDAYLYTQTQNMLIGTATANKSLLFLTGGGSVASNERMRIDGTGNVGIGISTPTAKLHVVGTNPLTLNGVQTGTNTSADSLLTITSGVVRKLPISTFATPANGWSVTGNSGTTAATNFLGTTDLKSLKFRTNNVARMLLDSAGTVIIGSEGTADGTNPEKLLINAGTTTSVNALVAKGTIDNYFQMNIKNNSSGANATTDIVATADNGTETSNYVDLGINGSGYSGNNIQTGVANDGYLISSGNDFYMVNSSANKSMLFLTGGTGVANERMRILANGRVGMGVQDPTAPFVVKDTMEIRRIGSLSQLLFTNTAGTGDFRIGGDGGDLFWQGGGSRSLQMGSYWTTVLTGDRQTSTYPAFINGAASPNTGVLVLAQRDASVPFGVQANSATQAANLTEWRNNTGTALSAITKDGSMGIGTTTFSTSNPEKLVADAGASGNTNYQNVIVGKGNTNNYAQLNIQNKNAGSQASSDVVATADNGDESSNYIDMGINSSGNNGTYFGSANDAYLYAQSQNLLIGTASAKNIQFLTSGGTANFERMRILSSGNVGIGVTAPTATLQLKAGTSTANTAPLKLTSGTNLGTPEAGAVEFDGANYFVTTGTTRYTMAKTLTATAVLDFPATTAGTSTTLTITVTGAADGDVVSLGVPSAATSGISGVYSAYVSAANTVTVKFLTGSNENPASGTFRVSVMKY